MKKDFVIVFLISIICGSIFTFLYVKNESPIYVYDYGGYHQQYCNAFELLSNDKNGFCSFVKDSIRNNDYNVSPILILAPFYKVFCFSRFGYILGLVLCYVVPAIVLAIFCAKVMLKKEFSVKHVYLIGVLSFLFTRFWAPTLRGLPDIIGVIPMVIATIIFFKCSLIKRQKIWVPILLGLVCYSEFLFRRWYVYSIIGFLVSFVILDFLDLIKIEHIDKKKSILNAIINYSLTGFTMITCLFICQFPLVQRIIATNYSEGYSAFQVPFKYHLLSIFSEFGPVYCLLAVIGLIWAIYKKEHRRNGLFLLFSIIICYFSFSGVQAMGVHHYLSISLWFFLLDIYGILCCIQLTKNKKVISNIIWVVVISLFIINFLSTFVFRNIRIPWITQNNKYCKFKYENFDNLMNLINDLDNEIGDKNVKFSVSASSEVLSDNIVDLLGSTRLKAKVVYNSAIDLRDGLNFNSLMSEYMIVSDIPQTGVNPQGQFVVSIPNNEIYNGTSIGKAYTRILGPYFLDENVKAYIYKKDRAFTIEEVEEYFNKLVEKIPQWNEKYNKFDILSLTNERKLGEVTGDYKRYTDNTMYFSPGTTSTFVKYSINKKIKKVKFKFYVDGKFNRNDKTAGIVNVKILTDGNQVYNNNVSWNNFDTIEIDLENKEILEFEINKNEYLNCDFLYVDILEVE